MRKYLLLFVLTCCTWLAGAQQLDCRFTQARTIQASGKVIRSEGVISFLAPDQLTMTYTQPAGEYLVISGSMLRTNSQGQQLSIDTSTNARFRNLRNTLLNCITGNCETAARDNDALLNLLSEPVQVHSNIEGGIGILGASSKVVINVFE